MNSEITGKIIVVGDNIDTDQIYPGCYLALTDPKEIGSHCLSGVDVNIAANFPQGGIVVAGRNFGCGSSREHAPIALLNMGAKAVILQQGHPRGLARGIHGQNVHSVTPSMVMRRVFSSTRWMSTRMGFSRASRSAKFSLHSAATMAP